MAANSQTSNVPRRTGAILVIEDDSELRELLEVVLRDEGHRPATAPDGPSSRPIGTRRCLGLSNRFQFRPLFASNLDPLVMACAGSP
jgi:hypothetical protein